MANVSSSRPEDWKYVSEGGATIVFAFIGHSNPLFDNTVLRLRKVTIHSSSSSDESSLQDEPDDPIVEFQSKCLARLIPESHLPHLQTIRLDRGWLESLHRLHNGYRPEGRADKDRIDFSKSKGVLATNLIGGDWLAIEIKPKWAFLPSPSHLSSATKNIKTRTCRFCMHAHLKAQKGETVPLGYCPLDLFSGDTPRVVRAVTGLWDSWNDSNGTINNLKIFARGKLIHPADAHCMLADDKLDRNTSPFALRDFFTAALVYQLMNTPVLHILSNLQRSLDVLDIEGLSKLWRLTEASTPLYPTFPSAIKQTFSGSALPAPPSTPLGVGSFCDTQPEPNITDWNDFLDTYLSPSTTHMKHDNPVPANLRYYLLAYLLSATFKDCSVIVRLDFLHSGAQTAGVVKPEDVMLIDLDPKSMKKLGDWERLDKEIVNYYSEITKHKICVDG